MSEGLVLFGDCRDSLKAMKESGVRVQTCVTSPPYFGLRDYGHDGQLGLEQTPEEYIAAMVEVFRCVRDVLADDGTLWVNIGDSYAKKYYEGERFDKPKDLFGIPWRLALALKDDGWYLRQDIIWHKTRVMPTSSKDRCTTNHEYIFLLTKRPDYYFDADAIRTPLAEVSKKRVAHKWKSEKVNVSAKGAVGIDLERMGSRFAPEKGANIRSVWSVCPANYKGAHFATFPPALIEPCVLAGSRPGDIVLDPFMGSGTTAQVAKQHDRRFVGCELNLDYEPLQRERVGAGYHSQLVEDFDLIGSPIQLAVEATTDA